MSIFEYNQEAHMESVRREGYEDGLNDGLVAGREEGIAEGIAKGIAQGISQGISQGKEQTIYSLVHKGLITIEAAARELNISVEEFTERLKKAEN